MLQKEKQKKKGFHSLHMQNEAFYMESISKAEENLLGKFFFDSFFFFEYLTFFIAFDCLKLIRLDKDLLYVHVKFIY